MCFSKQKTAYEMRISDWSSDVCSSDLVRSAHGASADHHIRNAPAAVGRPARSGRGTDSRHRPVRSGLRVPRRTRACIAHDRMERDQRATGRSEEHTSELQSLMRLSYAVFCLKKKKREQPDTHIT